MAEIISVKIDDARVLEAMEQLRRKAINPRSALLEMGEDLAESTKERFATSTAPDGSKWAKNSPVTMARWMSGGGLHKKNGSLTKKGVARLASKKPLIGYSKMLSHTIAYQLHGHTLLVGSPMEYASPHQFGAKKGEFGRSKRGGPIPWGNIPARPFLGLSSADRDNVIEIVRRFLSIS
jgi:phage virion morphogenesis protein